MYRGFLKMLKTVMTEDIFHALLKGRGAQRPSILG